MDALEFWQAVGPDDGLYCLFSKSYELKNSHKFFESREEAIEFAMRISHGGEQIYFGPNTYDPSILEKTKDGKPYITRDQEHVSHAKSLYVDIDCGPKAAAKNEGYAKKSEAVRSLVSAVKSLKLPKPLLLDSGGGVHAYWPLTEQVTRDEWQPVADRLKEALADEGLKLDVKVTSDCARVLRLPGTLNHKFDPPKEVAQVPYSWKPHSIDYLRDVLGVKQQTGLTPSQMLQYAKQNREKFAKLNSALGNDDTDRHSFKELLKKTLRGKGCEAMKIIATDQENVSEPLWRAGLSIAKHCRNASSTAIRISKDHPDYDEDVTLEKMNLIKGPYKCDKFKEELPDVCAECEFGLAHKWQSTPLKLAKIPLKAAAPEEVQVQQPAANTSPAPVTNLPSLPTGYDWTPDGQVGKWYTDDDGVKDLLSISKYPLYLLDVAQDNLKDRYAIFEYHLPNDPAVEINFPFEIVGSPPDIRKVLAAKGVIDDFKELGDYVVRAIQDRQASDPASEVIENFGWLEDHSFALGRIRMGPRAGQLTRLYASPQTRTYMDALTPTGDFGEWKKIMAFYAQQGLEMHQFIICAAAGSVLMEFMPGVAALNFHVHSKGSGYGKTTTIQAGLGVWGNPDPLTIDAGDTGVFHNHYPKVLHSLPVLMDEVTNLDGQKFSQLLYMWSGGRGKNRMKQSGAEAQNRGMSWSLNTFTTANCTILSKIETFKMDPEAEGQRILEVAAYKVPGLSKQHTDVLTRRIMTNYGWAGPVLIEHILKNRVQLVNDMLDYRTKIDEKLGLDFQNRFWSAGVTSALFVNQLAKKLGLWDFNQTHLETFAKEVIDENKSDMNLRHRDPIDYITDYLNAKALHFIRIKSKAMEIDGKSLVQANDAFSYLRSPVMGRFEYDTDKLYIALGPFKSWLADQQGNFNDVKTGLFNDYGAEITNARLATGTTLPKGTGATRCLVIEHRLDKVVDALGQTDNDQS